MSPWLLNLNMDGTVKKVQARTLERRAQLVSDYEEILRVSKLLFED